LTTDVQASSSSTSAVSVSAADIAKRIASIGR